MFGLISSPPFHFRFQPCALRCGITIYTQIKDLDKWIRLPIHSQSAPHRPTPQALKAYGCGTSFAWHNPFLDCLRQPENEKLIFRLPPIQIKNDIYNISQNTTAAQAKSSTTANINSPTLVDAFMLCTSIISTAMMCHKIIA